MIYASDPAPRRQPLAPSQCERCISHHAACESRLLFSGKRCCESCDHHSDEGPHDAA